MCKIPRSVLAKARSGVLAKVLKWGEGGRDTFASESPFPQLFVRHWAYSFWQDTLGFQIWHKFGERNVCVNTKVSRIHILWRNPSATKTVGESRQKENKNQKQHLRLFIPTECYLFLCTSLPDYYWDLLKWINCKIKLSQSKWQWTTNPQSWMIFPKYKFIP